jgi:Tfp pilus assembly protein PilF
MTKKKAFLLILAILFSLYLIACLNQNGRLFLPWLKNGYSLGLRLNPSIKDALINDTLELLRARKDKQALQNSEQILLFQPDNIDAQWIKAEVLRRQNKYQNSEELLNNILKDDPAHNPSLISLAYIKYNASKFDEAQALIQRVLKKQRLEREELAMAVMMTGIINSGRAKSGSQIFNKLRYGSKIKGYLLKAKEISPELAEVHLALGTFYLSAPKIAGGNLKKAKEELRRAIAIAPRFATAYARLAEVYKAENNAGKYIFYLKKARDLASQEANGDGSL